MNLRFTMGLCAIIMGVFSLTLCQPPTPRIARVEALSCAVATTSGTTVQGILAACDSTGQAVQIRDLDGLLSHFSKHSR